MVSIISWNIQCGLGCDGAFDLARIARVTRALGDADVICYQEVARHDPAYANGADQEAELRRLFPGYEVCFGAGLDRCGEYSGPSDARRQFGNALLSRLPVAQVFRHLLPHPAAGGSKHMQRQAVEAVVQTKIGPLRVVSTHLEYFSAAHRAAQIARLREIQTEIAANEAAPAKAAPSPYDPTPRPTSLVLSGDFNVKPDDDEYTQLMAEPLVDAWRVARGAEPHPPTTGLFDRKQWPMGGHCRDYFVVTPDIAQRVAAVEIDVTTNASDHQPLLLTLHD